MGGGEAEGGDVFVLETEIQPPPSSSSTQPCFSTSLSLSFVPDHGSTRWLDRQMEAIIP